MRKLTAFVIVCIACLLPAGAHAAKPKKPPVTLVFGAVTGRDDAPVSLEVSAAVADQLARSGQVEMVSYNPQLPNIARAVMEHRLPQESVEAPWDSKNALRIGKLLKADYALVVRSTMDDTKVKVDLEFVRTSDGRTYRAIAESVMAMGPRQGMNRSNAVSTASSSAVSQLLLDAFKNPEAFLTPKPPAPVDTTKPAPEPTPTVNPTPPVTTTTPPTTTVPPVQEPAPVEPAQPKPVESGRNVAAEYDAAVKRADVYIAKQDVRNAALELRHAVNLDPLVAAPRVKLASLYSDMGMNDEAIDECKRALLFVKDDPAIFDMMIKLCLSAGKFDDASAYCRELIRIQPNNVESRIALGDISWNQSRVDDAVTAYEDALKVDPKNLTAHERLRKLFSARKMYGDALKHVVAVRVPGADVEPDASKRYMALSLVIREEFAWALNLTENGRRDFDSGKITRDDYYKDCKEAAGRIDALATYLSTQTAPAQYREAHAHGVLAASLLAQATGYLVTFLETEKQHYQDQAALLEGEARTEMASYEQATGGNG